MSDLSEYRIDLGGVETTVQLSDEDAARYGDRAKPVKKAAPKSKAHTPANKAVPAE